MNVTKEINSLNLPKDSFVVVGSGILEALGIRQSDDIDMIVAQETYDRFEAEGWDHDSWSDQTVLKHDVFDIGISWYGSTIEELLTRATVIDGIPYLSLSDVYDWKKQLGRGKDLADLKLIDVYLAKQ